MFEKGDEVYIRVFTNYEDDYIRIRKGIVEDVIILTKELGRFVELDKKYLVRVDKEFYEIYEDDIV